MKKVFDLYNLERTNTLNLDEPFVLRIATVGFAGYTYRYEYPEMLEMYKHYLNSCRFLMEHTFNTSCKFMWVTPKKLLMYFKDARSYELGESNKFKSDKLTGINCSIIATHFNKNYTNLIHPNKIMLWNGYAYNVSGTDIISYLAIKQKNHVTSEGGIGLQDIFYRREDQGEVHGLKAPNFTKDKDLLKHFI